MKGVHSGAGLAIGAAMGLLLGLLFFDGWWLAPVAGAAVGLIIGAIVEIQSRSTSRR